MSPNVLQNSSFLDLHAALRSLDHRQVDKQVSQPFAWASFNVERPSLSGVRILDKAFLGNCHY